MTTDQAPVNGVEAILGGCSGRAHESQWTLCLVCVRAAIRAAEEKERERIIREHLDPEVCDRARRMCEEERAARQFVGVNMGKDVNSVEPSLTLLRLIAAIRGRKEACE